MNNEQQPKDNAQPTIQDNVQQTVQDNVQPQDNSQQTSAQPQNNAQPEAEKTGFFSTPLGKVLTGIGIVIVVVGLVVLKIGARSHNISKHAQGVFGGTTHTRAVDSKTKEHAQAQSMLSRQCKLMSSPAQKKVNGMECLSAKISDDNKDVVLTYRIINNDIVEGIKANENAADVIKENFCSQPKMKSLLKTVDSISMVYLDPKKEELLSVKITEC